MNRLSEAVLANSDSRPAVLDQRVLHDHVAWLRDQAGKNRGLRHRQRHALRRGASLVRLAGNVSTRKAAALRIELKRTEAVDNQAVRHGSGAIITRSF